MREKTVEIDQVISGYKLRSLIAKGQNSQVWEVVELASGRHLAMKSLLDHALRDKEQRRMLYHEAKVGQKLAHQHIIKIHKVSDNPKLPWFVMEFFAAGSMKFRIQNKQTDFIKQHAHKIFRDMATTLAYMHGSGWLHRDLKPDNILADSAGQAKLIDFAIALKKGTKRGFFARLLGRKHKVQGTPSYMAPEQIRGDDLDVRADLYSFGATMYEIVALRPPFVGQNVNDLLNKHVREKPMTPQGHNPEVTDDFAKLVMQLLAKKKEERLGNFHEVMLRLKEVSVFKGPAVQAQRS
jgi:serine/threonine protein kinase